MFDSELNKRESGIEWPLWLAVFGLMLIGAAFIYSATASANATNNLPWWRYTVVSQLIAYGVGLGAVAGLCLIEYHRIARWAMVGYWVSVVLLAAVFVVGVERLGARRWIDLGPVQFQPSEFAKLAFLFAFA